MSAVRRTIAWESDDASGIPLAETLVPFADTGASGPSLDERASDFMMRIAWEGERPDPARTPAREFLRWM